MQLRDLDIFLGNLLAVPNGNISSKSANETIPITGCQLDIRDKSA